MPPELLAGTNVIVYWLAASSASMVVQNSKCFDYGPTAACGGEYETRASNKLSGNDEERLNASRLPLKMLKPYQFAIRNAIPINAIIVVTMMAVVMKRRQN